MSTVHETSEEKKYVALAVEASVRVATIGLLVYWCYRIVAPFLVPILWGTIIAVAVYPLQTKLESRFGGRRWLAATVVIFLMLLVLAVPAWLFTDTMISGIREVGSQIHDGTLKVPPAPPGVENWPVVGKKVAELWHLATDNIEKLAAQYSEELKGAGKWLLSLAGKVGLTILLFLVSIGIAGVLLANADTAVGVSEKLARRLAGANGKEFVRVTGATIRSVVRGILGIAFIQSVMAGILLVAFGIPGAGLWAFACLLLAVMQIGTLPVLLPATIYMFATASTGSAIVFAVFAVLIGISDNVLKPFLLGRGAETPMLVLLVGSLGGLMASGVIGLFVGAVVLTLGYRLFLTWVEQVDRA